MKLLKSSLAPLVFALIVGGCSIVDHDFSDQNSSEEAVMNSEEAIGSLESLWYTLVDGIAPREVSQFNPDLSVHGAMTKVGCRNGESIKEGPPWRYLYSVFFEFQPDFETKMSQRLNDMKDEGWTVKRELDSSSHNPKSILVRDGFTINFSAPSNDNRGASANQGNGPEPMNLAIFSPCASEEVE